MMKTLYLLAILPLSAVVRAQNCEIQLPNPNGNGYGKLKKGLPIYCDDADVISIKKSNGKSKTFHKQQGGGNRKSYQGQDLEDGSYFQFMRNKDSKLFGSIVNVEDQTVTQLSVDASGNQVVKVTHTNDFLPEEEEEVDDRRRYLGESPEVYLRGKVEDASSTSAVSRQLNDDGSFLDIMVLWTKEAECKQSGIEPGCFLNGVWEDDAQTCKQQGETVDCDRTQATEDNMRSLIDLAIEETNTAFDESGVNTQLRLVHAQFFEYDEVLGSSEQESSEQTLIDIRTSAVVAGLRTTYGADMVSTIIASEDTCGRAYVGPHIAYMFSVVRYGCATGYYSFGHEIGHNLGCYHDRGSGGNCADTSTAWGWRDPGADFRTILGLACTSGQCDDNDGGVCTRIQRFSNPTTQYLNKPLGDAQNDNAAKINESRVIVAAYYPHVPPPTSAPTTSPPTTSAPTPYVDCGIYTKGGSCNNALGGGVCTWTGRWTGCVNVVVPTIPPQQTPPPATTEPTLDPSSAPSPQPSSAPSPAPSSEPSPVPSPQPSSAPSPEPSVDSTPGPTQTPSAEPSPAPSPEPSQAPSPQPSSAPSPGPSVDLTPGPTQTPSAEPSPAPSPEPSPIPSPQPSSAPSPEPSVDLTPGPTQTPSAEPTPAPVDCGIYTKGNRCNNALGGGVCTWTGRWTGCQNV